MQTTIKTQRNSIQITLAAMVFLGITGLFTSTSHATDMGMVLAKDRSIPGKNRLGECAQYADVLFAKMNAAGVEAYRVSFDWSNLVGPAGQQGVDAMVVFRDERGRFYGVDNMTWKPVWLKGNNSQEWANFITGIDTSASVRKAVASRSARPDIYSSYAKD